LANLDFRTAVLEASIVHETGVVLGRDEMIAGLPVDCNDSLLAGHEWAEVIIVT
jgi:hypothetical protein